MNTFYAQDKTFLAGLSPEQKAVVTHRDGHSIVSAVAGSGKTLTLIRRILFLLRTGADPKKILVVMFNRDAMEAFSTRLKVECDPLGLEPPEIFTFHKLGKRICQSMIEKKILPKADFHGRDNLSHNFIRQALKRATRDHDAEMSEFNDSCQIDELLSLIEVWKGDLLRPIEIRSSIDYKNVNPVYKDTYLYYEELRHSHGFRTFADLIYDPVIEIRQQDLRDWAGGRYSHILIDEYQDVNIAQQEMIQLLAGTSAQVMVVGDEDQCIYEWRGSRPDYMTGLFDQLFDGAKKYTLSHTYRFGHTLSVAVNSLIYQNKKRTKKLCISSSSTPATSVQLYQVSEANEENLIAALIQKWLKDGRKLNEVTILVRSWAMAVGPEMELISSGIPYELGDPNRSYRSRVEMQALYGLLSFGTEDTASTLGNAAQSTIQKMLRHSGVFLKKEAARELSSKLAAGSCHIPEALREFVDRGDFSSKIKSIVERVADQWQCLMDTLYPEMPAADALAAVECLLNFREQICKCHVSEQYASDAIIAVHALFSYVETKNMSLSMLLKQLADPASSKDGLDDRLLITSVHKAKGLEWPMVILPQLEEGRFPHFESEVPGDEELEQERRLFYVAMTRTIERLVMIVPSDEGLDTWFRKGYFGSPKKKKIIASRFVYETGLHQAVRIGQQIYSGAKPADITLGERDYLYRSYLRRL
jgi:DNA helicase-2/ATP-dependent DNA helicase PcrA